MAKKANKRVRVWSYDKAAASIAYIRPIFAELRSNFIRLWHLYKVNEYRAEGGPHDAELHERGDRGRELLAELEKIEVLPYFSPLRGIGLFRFFVHDQGRPREAYYVYKDTRDAIDSYIFNDEFCEHADLYGYERAVPEDWKRPEAVPKFEQEGGV